MNMTETQKAAWRKESHTAVVTGGASGIGLAAAKAYARLGMHVLIADRNTAALEDVMPELEALAGGRTKVLTQTCDVADFEQVLALADRAFAELGNVHCLMNNAGTGIRVGAAWENRDELYDTLKVNLWGVIHGCHAFVPRMLDAGQVGVVINTGSKQGITRPPGNYAYNLSKAGVLAYTESLAHDFVTREDCSLTAHLLVPGFVYTGMISRPVKPPAAWTPEQTVEFMLERLEEGDFYILCPDNDVTRAIDQKRIQWNADDLIQNRPALSRWHPEWKERFAAYMKD